MQCNICSVKIYLSVLITINTSHTIILFSRFSGLTFNIDQQVFLHAYNRVIIGLDAIEPTAALHSIWCISCHIGSISSCHNGQLVVRLLRRHVCSWRFITGISLSGPDAAYSFVRLAVAAADHDLRIFDLGCTDIIAITALSQNTCCIYRSFVTCGKPQIDFDVLGFKGIGSFICFAVITFHINAGNDLGYRTCAGCRSTADSDIHLASNSILMLTGRTFKANNTAFAAYDSNISVFQRQWCCAAAIISNPANTAAPDAGTSFNNFHNGFISYCQTGRSTNTDRYIAVSVKTFIGHADIFVLAA